MLRASRERTRHARHWIVVASLDHVRRGVAGGFVQACHGKAAPLGRMRSRDGIFCYAPTATFGGGDRLQAFAAFGTIADGEGHHVETETGVGPHRRAVAWRHDAVLAPIRPLLDRLELTAGRRNWGYAFRYGLLRIGAQDAALIAAAMAPALAAA